MEFITKRNINKYLSNKTCKSFNGFTLLYLYSFHAPRATIRTSLCEIKNCFGILIREEDDVIHEDFIDYLKEVRDVFKTYPYLYKSYYILRHKENKTYVYIVNDVDVSLPLFLEKNPHLELFALFISRDKPDFCNAESVIIEEGIKGIHLISYSYIYYRFESIPLFVNFYNYDTTDSIYESYVPEELENQVEKSNVYTNISIESFIEYYHIIYDRWLDKLYKDRTSESIKRYYDRSIKHHYDNE